MAKASKTKPIISYKGLDPDFKCRGFQFEVGKTYKAEGNIKACENGFHACENPFDVLSYYELLNSDAKLNRFALVEQSGDLDKHPEDSKIASAEITIKAELKLPEFIRAAVDWIVSATKGKGDNPSGHGARIGSSGDSAQIGSSGDYAQIGSSGDYARIGSSGDSAQIGSSGYDARIGSSGDSAQIGSSGDYAQIGSSGDYAQIGSSGDYAQIGSSGDSAQIGSSGYDARIGSSGHGARIVSEGKDAVIACAGVGSTFSGQDGAHVALAEYGSDGKCVGFATGCIGKGGLKAGVVYCANGGKLVEA
jgi:hypothetical protein